MPGASWTCGNCGFANTEPGPCSQCGAAASPGAPPDPAALDGEARGAPSVAVVPAADAAQPLALPPVRAAPARSAPRRSYVPAAYVVWFLYLLGYIGIVFGAVAWFVAAAFANIMSLLLVNRGRQKTGIAPKGRELLTFLLVTHFAIPVLLVAALLSVKLLYDDDLLSGSAAPVAGQISERLAQLGSIVGLGRPGGERAATLRLVVPSPVPTPTPTPDPWVAAAGEAKAVLDSAPGFERNLQTHHQSARQLSDQVSIVEETRPLLTTVAGLKSKGLPVVGNLWDAVVRTLNTARPGLGETLDTLVNFLDDISGFKARLDNLPSVDPVIAASSAFRNQPSRAALVSMDEAMQAVYESLASFDGELSGYLDQVDEVVTSLGKLEDGLRDVSSKYPQLAEPISAVTQLVRQAAGPIRDLQSSMAAWHAEIRSSLEVMDAIHRIVAGVNK